MAKCPYCGSSSILYDEQRGEYYCSNCGYVIEQEQVIDHYSLITAQRDIENAKFEWTSFADDTKNYTISEIKRIAANLSLPSYVVREAEHMYHIVYNKDLHRRKNISAEALAPAVILLACDVHKQRINFSILCEWSKADPNTIKQAHLKLYTILQSKTLLHNTIEGERGK